MKILSVQNKVQKTIEAKEESSKERKEIEL